MEYLGIIFITNLVLGHFFFFNLLIKKDPVKLLQLSFIETFILWQLIANFWFIIEIYKYLEKKIS